MLGVIPAGGAATRLQPILHSKEMTIIFGKPIIQYMVEKMTKVADRIVVVTWPEKTDVIQYCIKNNIELCVKKTTELSESLVTGFSHAKHNEDIIWGLTDTLWNPKDAFEQISRRRNNTLGLFPVDDPQRFTVIESKRGRVVAVYGKMPNPPSNYIWGIGKINEKFVSIAKEIVYKEGASNTFQEVITQIPFNVIKFVNGNYLDIGIRPVFNNIEELIKENGLI